MIVNDVLHNLVGWKGPKKAQNGKKNLNCYFSLKLGSTIVFRCFPMFFQVSTIIHDYFQYFFEVQPSEQLFVVDYFQLLQ